jgi:hypothetical protein
MKPSDLRGVATAAPRAAAPWIVSLARLGYVSTAIVYSIIGLIAFGAAFGRSARDADAKQALRVIFDQPFGRILLAVVALGLIGYAAWRFVSSINDAERHGNTAGGIAARAGGFLRGVIYLVLAVEALRMVSNNSSAGSGGQHWSSKLMEMPFGKWLIIAGGLGLFGYAVHQMIQAWKAKLSEKLRLGDVTPSLRKKIIVVSRIGIAARAIVLAIIGISLASAAFKGQSGDQNTGDALAVIGSWSHWLLAAVGIGLVAFALYQLVNARYRDIRAS